MSKTSSLLPLILLLIVIGLAGFIGFVIYQIANDVQGQTRKKMEKRNISFTKDGMRVGVKEKSTEKYADDTQSMLMKVWNASSWPAYKSKLGWGGPGGKKTQSSPSPAPGGSNYGLARTSSSQSHSSQHSGRSPATSPGIESDKRKPFPR